MTALGVPRGFGVSLLGAVLVFTAGMDLTPGVVSNEVIGPKKAGA